MTKNREGVLIHTYSADFHKELMTLLNSAHHLSVELAEHFRAIPYPPCEPRGVERVARQFTLLEGRLRKALIDMDDAP